MLLDLLAAFNVTTTPTFDFSLLTFPKARAQDKDVNAGPGAWEEAGVRAQEKEAGRRETGPGCRGKVTTEGSRV